MALNTLKELVNYVFPVQSDWRLLLVRLWPELVGDLHERMRLERIKGDVVIVGVFDACWIHELFMLSPTLITLINERLGGMYVRKLHFILTDRRVLLSRQKKIEIAGHKKTGISMGSRHQQVLRTIKDEQLQKILETFFYRSVG